MGFLVDPGPGTLGEKPAGFCPGPCAPSPATMSRITRSAAGEGMAWRKCEPKGAESVAACSCNVCRGFPEYLQPSFAVPVWAGTDLVPLRDLSGTSTLSCSPGAWMRMTPSRSPGQSAVPDPRSVAPLHGQERRLSLSTERCENGACISPPKKPTEGAPRWQQRHPEVPAWLGVLQKRGCSPVPPPRPASLGIWRQMTSSRSPGQRAVPDPRADAPVLDLGGRLSSSPGRHRGRVCDKLRLKKNRKLSTMSAAAP